MTNLLSARDVSEMTGICYSAIKRRCKNGNIPCTWDGNRYYIRLEDAKTITRLKCGRKPKVTIAKQVVAQRSEACYAKENPVESRSMVTSKSNSTDIPSTHSENETTTSNTNSIRKSLTSLFTRAMNSLRNTPTPKGSNEEHSTTLLTSWSRTGTAEKRW